MFSCGFSDCRVKLNLNGHWVSAITDMKPLSCPLNPTCRCVTVTCPVAFKLVKLTRARKDIMNLCQGEDCPLSRCCRWESESLVGGRQRQGPRVVVSGALHGCFEWQLATWTLSEGCLYLHLWHLCERNTEWSVTAARVRALRNLRPRTILKNITSSNFFALYCSAPLMKFSRMTSQRTEACQQK